MSPAFQQEGAGLNASQAEGGSPVSSKQAFARIRVVPCDINSVSKSVSMSIAVTAPADADVALMGAMLNSSKYLSATDTLLENVQGIIYVAQSIVIEGYPHSLLLFPIDDHAIVIATHIDGSALGGWDREQLMTYAVVYLFLKTNWSELNLSDWPEITTVQNSAENVYNAYQRLRPLFPSPALVRGFVCDAAALSLFNDVWMTLSRVVSGDEKYDAMQWPLVMAKMQTIKGALIEAGLSGQP